MPFCQSGYARALIPGQTGVASGCPRDAHRINPRFSMGGKNMATALFSHAAGGDWGSWKRGQAGKHKRCSSMILLVLFFDESNFKPQTGHHFFKAVGQHLPGFMERLQRHLRQTLQNEPHLLSFHA